jgi:acyl-CoA reductase-like NAD-dependent aldehyde dehydrogenase
MDQSVPTVHLHIGGQALAEGSGGVYEHIFPATGEVQGPVPLAGLREVDSAVEAAHQAFQSWRTWQPAERGRVLRRFAELLEQEADELSRLSTLDIGMPVASNRSVVWIASTWANYYAGWADKIEGRVTSTPSQGRELAFTIPEPYGVVGIITTWNGPMSSIGMKMMPALAAGNAIVLKPSELTPYAIEHMTRLVREAGIPDGVVNVVFGGPEVGEALVRNPNVQKVSFTGGPPTARKILAACAEGLKPAVLELGGKSPNIVFPDADLDLAITRNTHGVIGVMSGQGCAIPTRMVIHDDIYDSVAERVVEMARSMPVGDPLDPRTLVGPVVTKAAQERIVGMIDRAQAEGAGKLLLGGGVPGGELSSGFYVEPTVFGDVDPASELAQVEVFGPVLCLMRFKTDDEAVAIADATEYGLSAYVYTHDLDRVKRMARDLKAGGVYANGAGPVAGCELPFGGVGISGLGREGGEEGLFEFLRTKSVGIA